jgi:hypothetical protein
VKLLFFDDWKPGVLKGDAVIDVSHTVRDIPHTGPHNLISGLIVTPPSQQATIRRLTSMRC